MKREDLGQLRQSKGYSMNMMAEFLGGTLEEYTELEFGLRQPTSQEVLVLSSVFTTVNKSIAI